MNYEDKSAYVIICDIVANNKRFMDSYERIVWYCKLGISGAAMGEWNEVTANCLNNSKDIADIVYNKQSLQNPYIIKIYQKAIMACNLLKTDNNKLAQETERDCLENVLQYMNEKNLQEEMANDYFLLLDYIRQDDLYPLDQKKEACLKRLYIAQSDNSIYKLVNAYLSLYYMYKSLNDKTKAKEALKQAYEESKSDKKYHMTSSYCNLLCTVLNYLDEEINKAALVQELLKITPKIYGNDIRRSLIYEELHKYYSSQNDLKEIDCCIELLKCRLSLQNLRKFYDCSVKYGITKKFQEEVNLIYISKGKLTDDEIIALKDFTFVWEIKNDKELKNFFNTMIRYGHPGTTENAFSFRM